MVMEKLLVSPRKWISIKEIGIDKDDIYKFSEFVREESGGLLDVLYDIDVETGEIFIMLVMKIKSVSEGVIRKHLGLDKFTLAFLWYILVEEMKGQSYVAAQDIVHMLKSRGIVKEKLSIKKFINRLEEKGFIRVRSDNDTDFIWVRPTEYLRQVVDMSVLKGTLDSDILSEDNISYYESRRDSSETD